MLKHAAMPNARLCVFGEKGTTQHRQNRASSEELAISPPRGSFLGFGAPSRPRKPAARRWRACAMRATLCVTGAAACVRTALPCWPTADTPSYQNDKCGAPMGVCCDITIGVIWDDGKATCPRVVKH